MKSIKLAKYQAGMSMLGLTALIFGGIVIGKFFISVAPAFYDNYVLQESLKKLAREPGIAEFSKKELETRVNNFFAVNDLSAIPDGAISYARNKDRSYSIDVDYFVENVFFSNVFFNIKFKNQLNTGSPEKCCKAPEDAKTK